MTLVCTVPKSLQFNFIRPDKSFSVLGKIGDRKIVVTKKSYIPTIFREKDFLPHL